MSDPTTLTPPADAPDLLALRDAAEAVAPMPYEVSIGLEPRIVDAEGRHHASAWTLERLPVLRYLVAAANAAPGLVAERDRWQTFAHAAKDALKESERLRAAEHAEFAKALEAPAAEMAGMLDKTVIAKLAERDDLKARFLTATSDAVWAAHQRDTALARVAELERTEAHRRDEAIAAIARQDATNALLDALAGISYPTIGRAWDEACLLHGRYAEPWLSMVPRDAEVSPLAHLKAALARVAELEAKLARQAPVIAAARRYIAEPARDDEDEESPTLVAAYFDMKDAIRRLDKPAGCQNNSPGSYSGHWREWHRGHGCEKDPSNTTKDVTP